MSEVKTNKITSLASNNDITLDPDGTGDVVVASGHKLGVGTTSPVSNLHVITSDFKAAQFEGPRPTLFFKETDGSADENYQIRVNGGDLLFQSQNDAQSSAVDRMTIDSSGKVGIGTNSPPDDLSVVASGANAQLSVDRSDGASGRTVLIHSSTGGQLQTTGSVPLIFGTADTERIRIDASGDIGIGTSTITNTSSYRNIHIEGTSGTIMRFMANGTQVGQIQSDINQFQLNALTSDPIVFKTNNTERMRLDSGGRLFINATTAPLGAKMHIKYDGSAEQGLIMENSANNQGGAAIRFLDHAGAFSGGGIFFSSSNSVTYATNSDVRLKENIAEMTGAIDRVKALAPKRFNFITDADTTVDGFLAHEAQTVVPEAVVGTKDGVDDDDNPMYQAMDASRLVPLLTGALQEAIAKIETLETEMTTLKARVTALEAGE